MLLEVKNVHKYRSDIINPLNFVFKGLETFKRYHFNLVFFSIDVHLGFEGKNLDLEIVVFLYVTSSNQNTFVFKISYKFSKLKRLSEY